MSQTNNNFNENYSEFSDFKYENMSKDAKNSKKYYENIWYGYKKGSENDLRDDYGENFINNLPSNRKKIILFRIFCAFGILFMIDLRKNYVNWKHKNFVKVQNEVVNETYRNNAENSNKFEDYIKNRQIEIEDEETE